MIFLADTKREINSLHRVTVLLLVRDKHTLEANVIGLVGVKCLSDDDMSAAARVVASGECCVSFVHLMTRALHQAMFAQVMIYTRVRDNFPQKGVSCAERST